MIEALLAASLAANNPTFEAELGAVIDPTSIESVTVQEACSFWIDPEDSGSESLSAQLAAFATVCWQLPMSDLEPLAASIDAQFASARWSMSDAMGYTMIYHPTEPGGCLNNVAMTLMTADAPADRDRRLTAETAVLLFMTPREDLEACG